MKKILIFCGESAAGKDTLMQEVKKIRPTFSEIVSYTTRPKRDYEVDGVDYHFVDVDFMLKHIHEFVEVSQFNGWFYGTHIESLSNKTINIGVFNPEGVRNIISEGIDTFVVYVKVNEKTRLLRALMREDSPNIDEIIRRLHTDREDFDDIEEVIDYTHNNGDSPDEMSNLMEAIDRWSIS